MSGGSIAFTGGMVNGAALFDIDGTLVDSNYLHVEAWSHAFADVGIEVDQWRIHRMIGMDSALVLDAVLGDRVDELGDRAKELNTRYYTAMEPRLHAFRGARELLADLATRGVTVVLATSAPTDELETLRRILDVEDSLTHVTSSADVETAKPEPDIVQVALEKAGADAADSFLIGDSVWDVTAAGRAGVACIGVLSGGVSAAELREAGAIAVYDDVAQLRDQLDQSPLARLWEH